MTSQFSGRRQKRRRKPENIYNVDICRMYELSVLLLLLFPLSIVTVVTETILPIFGAINEVSFSSASCSCSVSLSVPLI